MIGKTFSHYKILKKLGEGGMGEVYLADDLKLERKVAIKFLPQHLTKDIDNIERFEREAKAAAALNHPNIVTIYDIIETEGPVETDRQICIIMEFVDGDSLRTFLDSGISDVKKIFDITRQICEGLCEAHKADIVHRDIKPENILIDSCGHVKILDFGLAKLKGASKLTKETSTLGTLNYMSPEQLQGEEIDQRSDIWSLGVILYELLTGEAPFRGEYESAVTYAIINEEPIHLNEIKAKYNFDLKKLLNKEPDKRFQNCQELLTELGTIISDGSKKRKSGITYVVSVAVLTILVSVTAVFLLFYPEDEEGSIKSLAVLPLENLSNDAGQTYFVDGITDVLISELAHIKAIKVISRTSVMQYKGVHKSLTKIADELNVDAVIEGTVFSDGQKVRITTQLIRAEDDRHLWSEKYEYDLDNIFSLQTEVASAIASAVKVQLTEQEKSRITSTHDVDPGTYQTYLKGRYHWHERTEEGILIAIKYFKQAIDKAPEYAAAYSGLADCYVIEPAYYLAAPHDAYPQARKAALRALEIDDQIAEAYTSLAAVRHNYDWDWSDAERLYQKAISINPNYATAHHWYAELLIQTGRIEEALKELNLAFELDPLSPIINMFRANIYCYARDYDRALKGFKTALTLHPNFTFSHLYQAVTYSFMNKHDEAIRSMQNVLRLLKSPKSSAFAGYIYARAGEMERALEIRDSLLTLPEQTLLQHPCSIAFIYIGLKNYDQAFYWLEKAYQQRDYEFIHLKIDPTFDPLRSDPRFIEFLKKMNLEN